jgi:hypothetical protein
VDGGYDRRVRLKRKSATAAITTMMRMVQNMSGLRSLLVSSEGIRGLGVASQPGPSWMRRTLL